MLKNQIKNVCWENNVIRNTKIKLFEMCFYRIDKDELD